MTTGTHTEAKPQVLRLQIDLGQELMYAQFEHQVTTLRRLCQFALEEASTYNTMTPGHYRRLTVDKDILLRSTSLASPWITVLADAAQTSAPVGYTFTAIYAVQKLMRLIMEWQRHRQDIAEIEQRNAFNVIDRYRREMQRDFHELGFPVRQPVALPNTEELVSDDEAVDYHTESAAEAIVDIGLVKSADMVDDDGGRIRR